MSTTNFELSHDAVEVLAFQFWLERGAPFGTPETDWFRAEEQLKSESQPARPVIATVAKTIGAALGSVAALVSGHGSD